MTGPANDARLGTSTRHLVDSERTRMRSLLTLREPVSDKGGAANPINSAARSCMLAACSVTWWGESRITFSTCPEAQPRTECGRDHDVRAYCE